MRLVFVELRGWMASELRELRSGPSAGPIRLSIGDGETNPEGAAE
jgi:hypothetical protein